MSELRCQMRRREDLDLAPTATRPWPLRYWECAACERAFTEPRPTALGPVCGTFEPKLQVGRTVRVRTNRRFAHLAIEGEVTHVEPGISVVIDEGRITTNVPWNAIFAVEPV